MTTVSHVALNSATATQVVAVSPNRRHVVVRNIDPTKSVVVGDSTVTMATGLVLSSTPAVVTLDLEPQDDLWAICNTGTPSVEVLLT